MKAPRNLFILTVGTGTGGRHSNIASGLAATVRMVRPRFFWLVPSSSPESVAVAELIQEDIGDEFAFKAWGDSQPFASIPEPDNLFSCRQCIKDVILMARKHRRNDERLIVNPTSGTKQMSVGATLAALECGTGEISFTVGHRQDGVVRSGTEELADFDTRIFLREDARAKADALFRAGAYAGAEKLLEAFQPELRGELETVRCLHSWQRMRYQDAYAIAARSELPALAAARSRLLTLSQAELDDLPRIGDLIAGARLALSWGDPEEALIRFYRATESAAKCRLASEHRLTPPYHRDEMIDACPRLAEKFRINAQADGTLFLGLHLAFDILQSINSDPLASDFFRDRRLKELLQLRHQTAAGHGGSAAPEDEVRECGERLRELLAPHFPKLEEWVDPVTRPRQLPRESIGGRVPLLRGEATDD